MATVKSDRQRHPRGAACGDCLFGRSARQREWFLDVDVFPGFGRGYDMLVVQRVRRSDNYRVYLRVLERISIGGDDGNTGFGGEVRVLAGLAGNPFDHADLIAGFHRIDEPVAPAPQAEYCSVQHLLISA
jgi:hypothetical protein